MPKQRISLRYTNRFRLQSAEDFLDKPFWLSVRGFADTRGLSPSTVISWVDRMDKLRSAERPGALTLGGSGRKSETSVYEDILTMRVKDLRRDRCIVTRAMIVFMAQEIMPNFFKEKIVNAAICWCARFMERNFLTLRRVTTRGRATRESMFLLKAEFFDEVRRAIAESVMPLNPGIDPPTRAFNMDQTAIFASTTTHSTVDEVGVRVVPALTAGSDSQRITMAVLVRAVGLVLPPHIVFKGQPGGEVEKEVKSYVPPHVATCSVPNVTGYSVVLLDALKNHKMVSVTGALGDLVSPLKTHLRQSCAQPVVLHAIPENSVECRRYMFDHAMHALGKITQEPARHSFDKAGPFFGCTTSADVQGMLDEARLLNVVDAHDDDVCSVHGVLAGEVEAIVGEGISL